MSPRPSENAPWPRQTQPPSPKRSVKRRKIEARQALEPQVREYYYLLPLSLMSFSHLFPCFPEAAEALCADSSNGEESCFPTSSSVFAQSEFVSFVCASRIASSSVACSYALSLRECSFTTVCPDKYGQSLPVPRRF